MIDQDLAQMRVNAADVMAKDKDVPEKAIELWIEHVSSVWKKDTARMKKALANWYTAMQEAGLAPEGENKMEQFIHCGI